MTLLRHALLSLFAVAAVGVAFKTVSAAPPRPLKTTRNKVPPHIALAKYPIRGTAIHFCSCTAPCPCMFNDGDMEGCNLAAVYRFEDGGYADRLHHTRLAGLTLVAVYRPRPLIQTKKGLLYEGVPVELVVYLPEGITSAQEEAAKFAVTEHVQSTLSGPWLVRRKRIRFQKVAGGYEVEVPGVLHARTEPIRGEENRQMVVDHVPFYEGERWLLGRSRVHTYQDPDEAAWKWDYPNSNGAWTHFSWTIINHY